MEYAITAKAKANILNNQFCIFTQEFTNIPNPPDNPCPGIEILTENITHLLSQLQPLKACDSDNISSFKFSAPVIAPCLAFYLSTLHAPVPNTCWLEICSVISHPFSRKATNPPTTGLFINYIYTPNDFRTNIHSHTSTHLSYYILCNEQHGFCSPAKIPWIPTVIDSLICQYTGLGI